MVIIATNTILRRREKRERTRLFYIEYGRNIERYEF